MNKAVVYRCVVPAIVFLISMVAGLYLLFLADMAHDKDRQLLYRQMLSGFSSDLELHLSHVLISTYLLEQEVVRSNGRIPNFDQFARSTLERFPGISNLQLAEDGIITDIYPLAGNEKAMGHDILRDDIRREDALAAISARSLTLAGPFTLVQGGVAVIGRYPVFLPTAARDATAGGASAAQDRFWGFTSALIMLDDLLEPTGLFELPRQGYAFRLTRVNPDTRVTEIIAERGTADATAWETHDVEVPRGIWTLAIAPGPTVTRPVAHKWLEISICLLVSSILTAWCRRLTREPARLQELVAAQTRDLYQLAFHDELTGLPNRHQFYQTLSKDIQSDSARATRVALLLLDLDRFKEVNDTLGHLMGDLLLVQATERMQACLPEEAMLVRLGGDEFTVIVRAADPLARARDIAIRILATLGQPFDLSGHQAHISASIGIAAPSQWIHTTTELLKCADQAMYTVKQDGRDGYCVFTREMQQNLAHETRLVADLRLAIQNDELELYYQPIICATTGNACKAEALLRWHHPELGMVRPDIFIPLAEANGLIHLVGDWVFDRAAQQLAHWRRQYRPDFQISVNVSALQFGNRNPVPGWIDRIAALELDPLGILIEMTESSLLEVDTDGRTADHKSRLDALRSAGFEVALDDFGTGYSSLSYLKQLDIDYLKIDRSFVSKLAVGNDDHAVCTAILSLAQRFGLRVVAEGIETELQQMLLAEQHCDYLQGYLFSPPVAAASFEQAWLRPGRAEGPDDQLSRAA